MNNEPDIAFPYKPPSEEIKLKYRDIFEIQKPLKPRLLKTIFDKFFSSICLFFAIPIMLVLKIMYIFEGIFINDSKGPLIFYYKAVSSGEHIKKYKIRIIKTKFIDSKLASEGDWHAYKKEWTPESRTNIGKFVKAFYLDELPQFWSIFIGDMSFVGPRPLAVHHYERDLAQGNVSRKLIKGGLLGLGHIHKGTEQMGRPDFEYEYINTYINGSSLELLLLDLNILWKGLLLVIRGKGL